MKKPIPFDFIIEELFSLDPMVKPMFGAHAVYVHGKIVFILRNKITGDDDDNGVWIATIPDYHQSLKVELPSMRSIKIFGPGVTGWQIIPVDALTFESEVLHACQLVINGDIRIGKIPKPRKKKGVK